MGLSRQEYWSGLPCPPPSDLPHPRIKPPSPASAGRFFTAEPRSHQPKNQSINNRGNIVTNSITTLKMTHIKKEILNYDHLELTYPVPGTKFRRKSAFFFFLPKSLESPSQSKNKGHQLSLGNGLLYQGYQTRWASLVAQTVKNPPAMRETGVRHLGQEDPLEKGKATRSSVLAWRILWTEEPGGLQSVGSQRVRVRCS